MFMMTTEQKLSPVVVVMDSNTADCKQVRSWFENSRFTTLEASNVFQAMGELADFTVADSPDIILLNVDCCDDDLPLVMEMVESVTDDVPVIAITRPKVKRPHTYYAGSLTQAVNQLETLIPSATLN
jgi:hypothetical protein